MVERPVDLLGDGAALLLGPCNCFIEERGILGLLGRGENEGGVGGSILRLVLADGCGSVSKSAA
jgi:hypothetical protein